MQWQERFRRARAEWMLLTFYERFEQVVILILTGLIALVVVFAVWNLALKIFHAVLAPQSFDPTDYSVFQAIFGAIFTVIIALEFKRSLLVVAERQESIVQVRTVILIALLAIVRKLIILDLASTDALQLFALAAAILALGAVYWLVRDQDRSIERDQSARRRAYTSANDPTRSGALAEDAWSRLRRDHPRHIHSETIAAAGIHDRLCGSKSGACELQQGPVQRGESQGHPRGASVARLGRDGSGGEAGQQAGRS